MGKGVGGALSPDRSRFPTTMLLRVLVSALEPLRVPGEALLRPVNAALEGITPGSREAERVGGELLRDRLEAMGALPAGAVALTPGGDLPHDFVLHAVLIAPDEGVTRGVIVRALVNALRRGIEWEIRSVVLPLLGAGPGQLPVEEAAEAMADALAAFLSETPRSQDSPATSLVLTIAAGGLPEARVVHDTLAGSVPGIEVAFEAGAEPEPEPDR